MNIKEARVVVTGASSGIGRATAIEFAKEGARGVGIGYFKDREGAKQTLAKVREQGAEGVLLAGDVGSERDQDSEIS